MKIPQTAKQMLMVMIFSMCTAAIAGTAPGTTGKVPWDMGMLKAPAATVLAAANAVSPTVGDHVKGLFRLKRYEFDKVGRMRTRFVWAYQIMDQTGVEEWDNTEVNWQPWHENRPEVHVRVIGPDGAEHVLKPEDMIESSAGSGDTKMYSDNKTLRAPFPALSIGAVVLEDVVTSEHDPLFDAGTAHITFLAESVHMERILVEIRLPRKSPFQYKTFLVNGLTPSVTKKDDMVTYRFDQRDVKADPETESGVPADIPVYAYLSFSNGKSWKKVAARYGEIVDKAIKGAHFPKEIISRKTTSPRETAVRFLKWINKDVRYIGLEIGKRAIVPMAPATVLKQGYGDCKDKASLLVAMLRQAGFKAHVALVRVHNRRDVDPDFPGFGRFNHAIVVIQGKPDVWFDATSQLNRTGILPGGDQGHYALIAWKKTKKLIKIPFCRPEENTQKDIREYRLAEKGYMNVTQTAVSTGMQEISNRWIFQDKKPDKLKEGFQSYVTTNYRFGKLKDWTISKASDLSTPFTMKLEIKGAGRGITQNTSAVAAVLKGELINDLPSILTRAPEEKTESGKAEKKKEKPRKYPFRLPAPFQNSIHCHIVPPDGFVPRKVPDQKTVKLGPITFAMTFAAGDAGSINTDMVLTNEGGQVSPEQIKDIRQKVADLMKKPAVILYFDLAGERQLSNGQYKEALNSFCGLVTRHPKDPIQYVRLARAYLKTGLESAALKTVTQAIELDPKNATAYGAKARILQHDQLGRRFGYGYDRAGAIAAFKKAMELDPNEWTYPADLAIQLEYDQDGRRYTTGKDMVESLQYYKVVADKLNHKEMKNNVPFDLMYLGKFQELADYAEKMDNENVRRSYKLLATVGLKGVKAAIKDAQNIQPVAKRRQMMIRVANSLLNLRRYQDVAVLFQEAALGSENAMDLESRADLFRKIERYEGLKLDRNKPEDVFKQFVIDLFYSHGWKFESLKGVTAPEFWSHYSESGHGGSFNMIYKQLFPDVQEAKVRQDVALDLMLGSMKSRVETDKEGGYRFTLISVGYSQLNTNLYMQKTPKGIVIIGDDGFTPLMGREILHLADQGKLATARKWMKWLEDEFPQIRDSENGLLMANPIHYFYNDSHRDLLSVRLAAASIMDSKCCAEEGIKVLTAGRGKWGSPSEAYFIDAALSNMYQSLYQPEKMLQAAEVLERVAPDSPFSVFQHVSALGMLGRSGEAYQLIQKKLGIDPDSKLMRHFLIPIASQESTFDDMWHAFQKMEGQSRLEDNDYNTVAWACLFGAGSVEKGLRLGRTAVKMSKGRSSYLHTLAALYAEAGRCREARNTLDASMKANGVIEPDENDWYVLGRIAEQYGEKDSAIEAYKKLKEPKQPEDRILSTYMLARKRLQALGAVDQ